MTHRAPRLPMVAAASLVGSVWIRRSDGTRHTVRSAIGSGDEISLLVDNAAGRRRPMSYATLVARYRDEEQLLADELAEIALDQ